MCSSFCAAFLPISYAIDLGRRLIFCKPYPDPDNQSGLQVQRLMIDPDVKCYSDDVHITLFILASVGLIGVSVGFPIIVYLRMRAKPNVFVPDVLRHYGFFFTGLEPDFWSAGHLPPPDRKISQD